MRLANWGLQAQSNPTDEASERGFIATAKNGELPSLPGMEKFNGKQRGTEARDGEIKSGPKS